MVETVRVSASGEKPPGGEHSPRDEIASAEGWDLEVPKVFPLLEHDIPTRWAGPNLGEHNKEVLVETLGLSEREMRVLRERGIIGSAGSS